MFNPTEGAVLPCKPSCVHLLVPVYHLFIQRPSGQEEYEIGIGTLAFCGNFQFVVPLHNYLLILCAALHRILLLIAFNNILIRAEA